ncbi:MAG: flagellar biosynthesis protein, partial [Pseudomonadota bacterium]|nr:flagellar biosynthesis protein [Pseudomonadota bacterium]
MTSRPRIDQAEGLRRMFAHTRALFVPVVANPSVAFSGVLLERLCAGFSERGATVLVVDAGERARPAGEMALVELAQCIEALGGSTYFLAARGLAVRFVDSAGSTRACLQRIAEAAPYCDVILVHASASELARLFAHRGSDAASAAEMPCAVVLVDDRPDSVTHAYTAMKLLAQRADLLVFDLVLAAAAHSPRAERIVAKLSSCADDF